MQRGHWTQNKPSTMKPKKNENDKEFEMKKISRYARKYGSFKFYLRNIFKDSLITSLPEIAVSNSWIKRLVKITVFILCVIGFIYQTSDFLKIYWSYPTVVNIEVSNPFQIEQPAITVCNRNRIRRTVYCTEKPESCSKWSSKMFCDLYARSCPDNGLVYTAQSPFLYAYVPSDDQWDDAHKYAHTEKVIKECSKMVEGNSTRCDPKYYKVGFVTSEGNPNLCYTIESQWGKPNEKPAIYTNTFSFTIIFKLEPEEYTVVTEPATIQFAVHDRRMLINPYTEGYLLVGGNVYNAYISMSEKETLEAPYDTNCTDYVKLWKERNGTGPLNEMMCVEECKLNILRKTKVCVDRNVAYPHEDKLCPPHHYSVTSEMAEQCTKQCNQACKDKSYELRIETTNNYDSICSTPWCKSNLARITIYFKRFRVTKFKYQPKFESIEMFSYIGGYMGMWLGLSLVSLFDLFETFLSILYFPFGRHYWRKKKEENRHFAQFSKQGRRVGDHYSQSTRNYPLY